MKKSVLMVLMAGTVTAYAQNRIAKNVTLHGPALFNTTKNAAIEPGIIRTNTAIPSVTSPAKHQVSGKKGTGTGNRTQTLCEVQIGSAGNQFGSAYGPKTNLNYNRDLNTLTFIHRSNDLNGWPNTANILYDISTDGGVTWQIDQGAIYADNANILRARYPQGAQYNPPGNTDPANSFVTAYGPSTDGTNWTAHYKGTSQVGTSTQVQATFPFSNGLTGVVPQGGIIIKNTGDVWWSGRNDDGSQVAYNDSVVLSHGVWNSTTNEYDYTFDKIPVPVKTDIDGAKMWQNCAVIFNDAGDIGYIVTLGNDWVNSTDILDSSMGIIVYKTINGGASWSEIPHPNQNLVDQLLLNGGYAYMTSSQLDLAVDRDNVLHIALPVVPFQEGNTIYLGYEYASWGLFDFSTSDGLNWNVCLIAKPETYYGDFGIAGSSVDPQIQEENRLQISRNWEGSKLFYTWFDTDTAIFGPGLNNFPDARAIGMDLDGGLWTSEEALTEFSGTSADGNSMWGNVCYYTINDGQNENIPFVIDVMTNNTGEPVDFFYEGCAAMSNFVNAGTCFIISGISQPSHASGNFEVSANYPNPYTGKTTVNVTLVKATDITIEVTNSIGQLLSTVKYKNLSAGVNALTIDGSSLSKGLYFYSVKTDSETVTKTMSVE